MELQLVLFQLVCSFKISAGDWGVIRKLLGSQRIQEDSGHGVTCDTCLGSGCAGGATVMRSSAKGGSAATYDSGLCGRLGSGGGRFAVAPHTCQSGLRSHVKVTRLGLRTAGWILEVTALGETWWGLGKGLVVAHSHGTLECIHRTALYGRKAPQHKHTMRTLERCGPYYETSCHKSRAHSAP